MNIMIDNKMYEILYIKKKVKRTTIKFRYPNCLIVTTSNYTKEQVLTLIERNLIQIKKMIQKIDYIDLRNDEYMLFGKKYQINNSLDCVIKDNMVCTNEAEVTNFGLATLKKIIAELIKKHHFNENVIINYRKMKSRYGVCFVTKNKITFTTHLIHMPIDLIEYVVIHEFCHFKSCRHDRKFYQEVFQYCPNYKEKVKELKKYSIFLK